MRPCFASCQAQVVFGTFVGIAANDVSGAALSKLTARHSGKGNQSFADAADKQSVLFADRAHAMPSLDIDTSARSKSSTSGQ
jgi:prepilin-type processing-associated H-X9-DG protein